MHLEAMSIHCVYEEYTGRGAVIHQHPMKVIMVRWGRRSVPVLVCVREYLGVGAY